jgi:hypothetical protein
MGSWGEQYSIGNQGEQKKEFWKGGFSKCPVCKGSDISKESSCAGCRHNGDGYGTEEFKCNTCNWLTSFQYDESGKILFAKFRATEDHICFYLPMYGTF